MGYVLRYFFDLECSLDMPSGVPPSFKLAYSLDQIGGLVKNENVIKKRGAPKNIRATNLDIEVITETEVVSHTVETFYGSNLRNCITVVRSNARDRENANR